MNLLNKIKMEKIKSKAIAIKNYVLRLSLKKKIIFLVIIIGLGIFTRQMIVRLQKNQVTYETAQAEKETLINSISASGTITSGNNTTVTTKVSGVVKKVYVTNGDKVVKGQKIAEIDLDDYAQERQTAAWVKYLEATEAVKEAEKAKVTADIDMWEARQDVLDAQEAYDDKNENNTNPATNEAYTAGEKMIIDKTLDESKKAFTVAESKYLNADADIANAKAKVAAALRDYQENSAMIIAPASGVISDLMLAPDLVIAANSSTSSTSGATIVSSQTIGKISNSSGQLIASVNITEIDVLSVKANQKVTLTLDAYPDKSFTGKVLAVNTSGSVSSGVTSYPVTILLDPVELDIYPNMAVSAEIITNLKTDVILVPTTAVTSVNGQSSVQIKKDGKISTVQVEIGDANDSQTEIISGLNEGDEVVTAVITSSSSTQKSGATSPFSGLGRTTNGSNNRSGGTVIFQGGFPGRD
jgi:HlyD family secretion protein